MSADMIISQAGPEDADAIRALTCEAYAKWVPQLGREPIPMTVDYHEALTRHRFDLLTLDQGLVGLIETEEKDGYLLIENVAVRPAYQGRGLGRRLMEHAERLAAAAGLSEVKLYTNKLFAEDIAIYERLGYRIEREENRPHYVLVHMHKAVR